MWSNSAPEFASSSEYDYVPAKVIDHSYKKVNNYIIINAGKRLGVQPGMGVVSAQGWVGTVSESTRNYAYILPFTHSKGGIGARIEGKGLGQLSWSGSVETAFLNDIEREFEPKPGDSIYSYTRAEIAPPVLTGIVQSASQSEEDLSWNATVNLTTDFMNMDWVYVANSKGRRIGHLKTKYGMNVGRILGVAVLAIFVQWLLIQDLPLTDYGNPYIYLWAFFVIPFNTPRMTTYVLAFIIGSTLDSLEQSGGAHTIAGS